MFLQNVHCCLVGMYLNTHRRPCVTSFILFMRLLVLRMVTFDTRAPVAKCTGPPSFKPASSSEARPPHALCPLSQEAANSRPPQHTQGSPCCMFLWARVRISLGTCWGRPLGRRVCRVPVRGTRSSSLPPQGTAVPGPRIAGHTRRPEPAAKSRPVG